MKRIIIISLLFTLYGFGTAEPVSAIFCANCSTVALQIPQFAKEIINTGANVLNQVNTYLLQNKTLVLDPIQNAMIAASLLSQ